MLIQLHWPQVRVLWRTFVVMAVSIYNVDCDGIVEPCSPFIDWAKCKLCSPAGLCCIVLRKHTFSELIQYVIIQVL
jgi:hypothetical protein